MNSEDWRRAPVLRRFLKAERQAGREHRRIDLDALRRIWSGDIRRTGTDPTGPSGKLERTIGGGERRCDEKRDRKKRKTFHWDNLRSLRLLQKSRPALLR